MKLKNEFEPIREWARERGIYKKGDAKTQYLKLGEEFGELGKALLKKDLPEINDAIGDMVVVLTNLAHLAKLEHGCSSIEECVNVAYNVIKNRKGEMFNGSFIKDSDTEFGLDFIQNASNEIISDIFNLSSDFIFNDDGYEKIEDYWRNLELEMKINIINQFKHV